MRKKTLMIMSFIILTVMIFSVAVSAKSLSDMKKEQKEILSQSKKAKDLLNDAEYEKNVTMEEVLRLDADIEAAEDELEKTEADLLETELRLENAEIELEKAEKTRDDQYETLKNRICFMYENGDVGYIEMVLSADSFVDFINRIENIAAIIDYDKSLMQKMEETKQLIENKVAEITNAKNYILLLKADQETKMSALEQSRDEKNSRIELLMADENFYNQQLADLNSSEQEITKLIKSEEVRLEKIRKEAEKKAAEEKAAAAKNAAANFKYVGGKLLWPVPSSTTISSSYGWRIHPISKKKEFHAGIDIPAKSGSSCLAAADGIVIKSQYASGYGNTVIIDHGGTLSTLYGHNSKLLVSVGEVVTAGQKIALVGSTGYSTGPHVHFEVRINGEHTNPEAYLK